MSDPVDWQQLLRTARAMIGQVNSEQQVIDSWSLGGGTAMMLQINHRESRDIVAPKTLVARFSRNYRGRARRRASLSPADPIS